MLTDLVYIELARIYSNGKHVEAGAPAILKIRKLLDLVDRHFKSKKFPKQYAGFLNLSTRSLNRICQETLGKSTNDLIIDRILLEAKRMLIHTDLPVSFVSEELGYEDSSYFIRLFKKKCGVSPKQFQIQLGP